MLIRFLVGAVDLSRRHAWSVLVAGILAAAFSAWFAAARMGVTTDTDQMFSAELPWRKAVDRMNRDFPQFDNLIVAVVDARIPEEAEETAKALAEAASRDKRLFKSVVRPDASPYFEKQGLMLLDTPDLAALMEQTIDAQPFLGQLVADPSARGLFAALALLGMGVDKADADLAPFAGPIRTFHEALADALDGKPRPLSWQTLLGGKAAELAGPYRFVLIQPVLDFNALEPGGAASDALRKIAAQLEFVKTGSAHVRLTGSVPLADEEFSTVAQGAIEGLIASVVLITLWLLLALRSWRLILPVLVTLGLGLMLTVLFAAAAIGTLNLVSVGFGVLFVGIAVDFAIQFAVRYREQRHVAFDPAMAMAMTAEKAGNQIFVAALAIAAGFLAFVPTDFSGVAELGLIAGIGMLIAFGCTITFLPAAITLCRPQGEPSDIGLRWGALFDPMLARARWPLLGSAALMAAGALALSPRLVFDADPLHTKDPTTEAMRTLRDLIDNPLTNPYTIDILVQDEAKQRDLVDKLSALPSVSSALSILTFVPEDQPAKLAILQDARTVLGPTLTPPAQTVPATPADIRLAAKTALAQIDPALRKLPKDHPLAAIAADLRRFDGAPDGALMAANRDLTRFLGPQLDRLRAALSAGPTTRADIPEDIARDWISKTDGMLRIQVNAKPGAASTGRMGAFIDEVRSVAPDAGGAAVIIEATGQTIVHAFEAAGRNAFLSIALILVVVLRRVLDVALVLAPLAMSALLTLLIVVLAPIPLNFASIIALPLLLGVGVSFNIYFVMNWRAGSPNPVGSATARAIVFSAFTTATAFGSLALSDHPGTASMGKLLLISLLCTLVSSLVFIPALLASLGPARNH